jgi:DNA adenine methylase
VGTEHDKSEVTLPFLKWAGGKRWLVTKYPAYFSADFDRYIEPFLGSGAVFFNLRPTRSLLSDANERLIETYAGVRDAPSTIEERLEYYQERHDSDFYYRERDRNYRLIERRASQFIYLNRVCWNGLYRVNRLGRFNVPLGTKTNVVLGSDDFEAASACLKGADLISGDFEQAVSAAGRNDLIFADPPYTVRHNLNGFVKYNQHLFRWEDQIRLAESLRLAKSRGARFVVSNADHASVRELYEDFAKIDTVRRPSVIGGKFAARGETTELVISG